MNVSTFDEFYDSSFRPLVGQIYAMCGSLAEAQDLRPRGVRPGLGQAPQLDTDRSPRRQWRVVGSLL